MGHDDPLVTGLGLVNGREVEEVIIYARFNASWEEGGDEVALLVQPALGRVVEHGQHRIAK